MKRFLLFYFAAIFSFTLNGQASNPPGQGAQGTLPIRLLAFNATKISSSKSFVNWETADFSSADEKFEIQRACSDKKFVTIGTARGSETSHSYDYTDNDARTGVNYYRLRMTDKDKVVSYSKTLALMNNINGFLITSLIPTVVTDNATISVSSSNNQKLSITIADMQGRMMLRRNFNILAGNMTIELSMPKLGAGAYLLTGITAEGRTQTIRFIKQ